MDLGLKGKVAFVAASSEGLGKAVAMELANEGATIIINGRNKAKLESTRKDIEQKFNTKVIAVSGDLADENFIPSNVKSDIGYLQMKTTIDIIKNPDLWFEANATQSRDIFLSKAFRSAISNLENTLGNDMSNWQYGQEKFKHSYMAHALSNSVTQKTKSKLDLGPLPRGGNSYTPGSTGGYNNQSSGGSFRMIVNTGDWDAAIGTNGPGQSGNPDSPFYSNLFEPWAKDQYFPVYYSREKIDSVTVNSYILKPKN